MIKRKRQYKSSNLEMESINIKDILDSETYLENERKLNKSGVFQQKNYDSEDEIMKFSDEEEEEKNFIIENDNDISNDFNIPNEKSWGKKKKSYYLTDYVDADYTSITHKDIAHAELEEGEAINLQKRLSEYLSESDFGLDLIISKDSKFNEYQEHIKSDLNKLNKRQKQELLDKENPEFRSLVIDFKDRLIEVKNLLSPFMYLIGKCNFQKIFNFISLKHDILLHYCTNLSFYLVLKAKKEVLQTHPVINRLSQYRQFLLQLEKHQQNVLKKIKILLKLNKNSPSLNNLKLSINHKKTKNFKNNHSNLEFDAFSKINKEQDKFIYEVPKILNIETYNTDVIESEKRAITYEIAKNKGLTPRRKKEQRNPRVKNRNKYRKATIRRKGAIQKIKKETIRYDGEKSGIKISVKKSIKLK